MPRPLLQQPLHDGWRFRVADARLGDTEQFTATTALVPPPWSAEFEDNFLDPLPGEARHLRVNGIAGKPGAIIATCLNTLQGPSG